MQLLLTLSIGFNGDYLQGNYSLGGMNKHYEYGQND